MEHRLWSSPERGHQKETIKKKKTCVLNILTSGRNRIKWNLWSTWFPECVITSMDILTPTWSPCCSGTSLPLYQVTLPVFPVEGRQPRGLGSSAEASVGREDERGQCEAALLGPLCFPLWHLKTSSDLASLGNEGSVCDEWCGSWSTVCFLELV